MVVVAVAICGALFAGGLAALVMALAGIDATMKATTGSERPWRERVHAWARHFDHVGLRLALAGGAALVLAVMTGWPVGTILAAVTGFAAPSLVGGKARRERDRARLDAIATWTEQLRDVMAAASGLEQAITTTAPLSPPAIRPEVTRLAAALSAGMSMRTALRRFAGQLDDPAGDLVVAALILAAEGSPRQLGDLLGRLAATARDEVKMRMRIETGRARTRSSVKVVTAVTVAFSFGLVVLNPEYVAAYHGVTGQIVLVAVAACFAAAYWWLARAGRDTGVSRFLVAGNAPVTVDRPIEAAP